MSSCLGPVTMIIPPSFVMHGRRVFDVHLLIASKPIKGIPMKKLLTAITVAVFLIYPCFVSASYVIHLKDGREFTTDRYYEEGDQIKFKRYGGLIGIKKDLVREIEEVEDVEEPPPEKAVAGKKEGTKEAEKVKARGEPEKGFEEEQSAPETPVSKGDDKEGKGIDEEYYKNQKEEFMLKYKEAKKKLNDAILRNDKRAKWEAKTELKKIQAKLSELIRELKFANDGILPDWWHKATKPQQPDN